MTKLNVIGKIQEIISCYLYDCLRYIKYSATFRSKGNKTILMAHITRLYHSIEKGMALPSPRIGFGRKIAFELIRLIEYYTDKYGIEQINCIAFNVLCKYMEFNKSAGLDDPDMEKLIIRMEEILDRSCEDYKEGGIVILKRSEILEEVNGGFEQLVLSRHSIRMFEKRTIDREMIEKAVEIAIHTPSVCNRQCWRVHCYSEPERCAELINIQGGGRGFAEAAKYVLIVTANLNVFWPARERNQPFVDGGMFGMSLNYALHSLGLGTCCLNLAFSKKKEEVFRMYAAIPKWESFIFMIAVGHIPEKIRVTASTRKKVNECLTIH